jgi:RND family efflux transporter MFP subunit
MGKWNRWIGLGVGGLALLGGLAAVLFVDFSPTPPPPDTVVRPVKSAVVIQADALQQRRFRGQVVAGKTVDLAFQVGGQIKQADLKLGRQVQQGDILAQLDTTPLDQQIAVLEPTVRQTREKLEAIKEVARQGAATVNEVADAQAAYDKAVAQLEIATQAKADATLKAPFDALIVQRFAERFENVQARQPVVRLQDISSIDVRVELPESIVARSRANRAGQADVRFASLPDQSFPVSVKEASGEADPTTGGYPVTYSLPRPENLTVLPGMGATIVLIPPESEQGSELAVPAEAVFVDDVQGRCVWQLQPDGQSFIARKTPVQIAKLQEDVAIVTEGLQAGWRVATAGIHFLSEGQVVRLLEEVSR